VLTIRQKTFSSLLSLGSIFTLLTVLSCQTPAAPTTPFETPSATEEKEAMKPKSSIEENFKAETTSVSKTKPSAQAVHEPMINMPGSCEVMGKEYPCSEECYELGACTLVDDECRVLTDDDCKESLVCSRFGHCSKLGDKCGATKTKSCSDSDECKTHGRCTLVRDFCGATKLKDCQTSIVACERDGECGLGDGRCIAVSEEDCELSRNCINQKKCFLKEDSCTWKEP